MLTLSQILFCYRTITRAQGLVRLFTSSCVLRDIGELGIEIDPIKHCVAVMPCSTWLKRTKNSDLRITVNDILP